MKLAEDFLLRPDDVDFTDEHHMLLTRQIYGYILRERRWELLDVSFIRKPRFQENMMTDLVLKDEAKNLIQALSNPHSVAFRSGTHIQ
jgi:hypothetical protein